MGGHGKRERGRRDACACGRSATRFETRRGFQKPTATVLKFSARPRGLKREGKLGSFPSSLPPTRSMLSERIPIDTPRPSDERPAPSADAVLGSGEPGDGVSLFSSSRRGWRTPSRWTPRTCSRASPARSSAASCCRAGSSWSRASAAAPGCCSTAAFRRGDTLEVPLADVRAVEKKNSAGALSAIRVRLGDSGQALVFCSLLYRENAYQCVREAWHRAAPPTTRALPPAPTPRASPVEPEPPPPPRETKSPPEPLRAPRRVRAAARELGDDSEHHVLRASSPRTTRRRCSTRCSIPRARCSRNTFARTAGPQSWSRARWSRRSRRPRSERRGA